jgi:hypothetical protein
MRDGTDFHIRSSTEFFEWDYPQLLDGHRWSSQSNQPNSSRCSRAKRRSRFVPQRPNFSQIWERWESTVRGLMPHSVAISSEVLPWPMSLRMRRSAIVSRLSPGFNRSSVSLRLRRCSSKSVRAGLTKDSPCATAPRQPNISSAAFCFST